MANSAGVPRRIFRRSAEPLAADVSLIASEFLAGFQLVQQIDRARPVLEDDIGAVLGA